MIQLTLSDRSKEDGALPEALVITIKDGKVILINNSNQVINFSFEDHVDYIKKGGTITIDPKE